LPGQLYLGWPGFVFNTRRRVSCLKSRTPLYCAHAARIMPRQSSKKGRIPVMDTVRALGKEFYHIWITERPSQFAASLAYYGIFSFVPIVFIAFAVAGIFIDEIATADQMYAQVAESLGVEAAQALEDALTSISEGSAEGTVIGSLISFVALLFAASLMFFQLQHTLNSIWRVPPPAHGETRAYITKRLLAFGMVVGVGLFLILVTLVNFVVSLLGSFFDLEITVAGLTLVSHVALAAIALALIYKVLPDAEISWRDVWIGSTVTAVLIVAGVNVVGLYLGRSKVGSALEAAGAVAIFLMAFYFVAQLFV
jgi:membrane protein